MRTLNRIGIGLLVGLFFAVGYSARLKCTNCERIASTMESKAPVLGLGTPIASVGFDGTGNIDFRPIETLYSVLKNLREHYVDQVTSKDEGKMTYDALKVMLSSLNDPNTRFVEPAQKQIIEDSVEGKFHGIGAVLGIKEIKSDGITSEHLIVVTPISSSPAAKAGLKAGDDIVAIDGKSVLPFDPYLRANKIVKDARSQKKEITELRKVLEAEEKRIDNGISIPDAEDLLISDDKKSVELTVARRGNAKQLKIKIDPAEFTVDPVTSSVVGDGNYGYIAINCFSANTGQQFGKAIEDLKTKDVKGLVLDLRNVSGGDMESTLQIGRRFIPEKTLAVLVKSRNRRSTLTLPSAELNEVWAKPVVVLVNGGTARMPEVLAAALRDSNAAKLVGEKTYGDFSHSTLIEQKDGSAVLITTGVFVTSKNKNYSKIGLPVDVGVAYAPGDTQLKEAVKLLTSGGGKS